MVQVSTSFKASLRSIPIRESLQYFLSKYISDADKTDIVECVINEKR